MTKGNPEIPNIESETVDVRPLESESRLLCPHCIVPLGQRWTKLKFVSGCPKCAYAWCTMEGREATND